MVRSECSGEGVFWYFVGGGYGFISDLERIRGISNVKMIVLGLSNRFYKTVLSGQGILGMIIDDRGSLNSNSNNIGINLLS